MEIRAVKTRIFREGEALAPFILKYIKKVSEKSVIVITSKIVSLAEGRVLSAKNKERIVKQESDIYLNAKTWFTVKDGLVMPKAGIDESNVEGKLSLLPKDSYKSAEIIRKELQKKLRVKNLGVIISDSNFLPMRAGAIGVALGYAGFRGLENHIGKKDIFGRVLKVTSTNVADSLATAAVFLMGEGNERQPIAVITHAPVKFTNRINKKELRISRKYDMYAPLLNKLN